MEHAQAALVLTKAAAYDNRTIGEANVHAWAEALDDIEYADALEAVARHYRESEAMAMPVHIRRHAEAVARERSAAARQAAADAEECEHRVPGGAEPIPATGLPRCPLCRRDAAA